jgi:protease-4
MTDAKRPGRVRRYFFLLLLVSLVGNLVAFIWYLTLPNTTPGEVTLFGDARAADKVAVVRVSGVLTDSTVGWPIRQLERAAADPKVKAVVLRVDSPGGTISASDELYRALVDVRENRGRRFPGSGPKPVVASMGALAASGGYYIAVAGHPVFAERTTITGSIGVFAALPNAAEFAEKNGFKMELVKAGGIKASGSVFHTLTPLERQPWQDTVDHAYDQFLSVISAERPHLSTNALRGETVVDTPVPERDAKGNALNGTVRYTRVRADGGTFTPSQAKQFGLVDELGDLTDAVKRAASDAALTAFRAVGYDRPKTWSEHFLGIDLGVRHAGPALPDLSAAFTPRLWYLAPQADLAGAMTP